MRDSMHDWCHNASQAEFACKKRVPCQNEPMILLSAPSSTLGCKSWNRVYAWRMDLAQAHPFPLVHEIP
jgi:hypothetical protein